MKSRGASDRRAMGYAAAIALAVALVLAMPAGADGPNRAALILLHGNGQSETRCVEFDEPQITGLDLLKRAGVDPLVDTNGGAVCRLQNEGCNFPAQACFCQCQGATCIYWSYWLLAGNAWQYSSKGAAISTVHNGDVNGWVWGPGTLSSAAPPPVVTFGQVCTPPTATPSPTDVPPTDTPEAPTATRRPAATRVWRINTPEPTDTPSPAGVETAAATDLPAASETPGSGGTEPSGTPASTASTGPDAASTPSAEGLATDLDGQVAQLPAPTAAQVPPLAEAVPNETPTQALPQDPVNTGDSSAPVTLQAQPVPAAIGPATNTPAAPTRAFRPTRAGPTPTALLQVALVEAQAPDAPASAGPPGSLLAFGLFLGLGAAAMVFVVRRR